MRNIYTAEGERGLLLYSYSGKIYLRSFLGERAERAVILANDFQDNLSDVSYNNTIYYGYTSTKGEVVVKNILEQKVQFSSMAQGNFECFLPHVNIIGGKLALLFFIKNPLDQKYILKVVFPLNEKEFLFPEEYDELPCRESIVVLKSGLVFLDFGTKKQIWKLLWQGETCVAKKQKLTDKMEMDLYINESIALQKRVKEYDLIIQSIKKQYDELMNTATLYKEEANKWREKYYSKK